MLVALGLPRHALAHGEGDIHPAHARSIAQTVMRRSRSTVAASMITPKMASAISAANTRGVLQSALARVMRLPMP
jgi:hypothetical protein